MSPPKTESASLDAETEITLGLLDAVEKNNALTQRSIAKDLGIALGLANAYLKRCIKKGLIKVTQAPANRYAYYLTPKGFVEKSRLTSRYLSISFNFFRRARGECVELLEVCSARGWNRIALGGVSDLAEIAILCAREYPVELAGIVDARTDEEHFAGLRVFRDLEAIGPVDAVIVTDIENPQATFELTIKTLPPDRVLAPSFFKLSRGKRTLME